MKQKISISIEKGLLEEIKKEAKKQSRTLSNYIEYMMNVELWCREADKKAEVEQ